jgi:hypothetical protein
VLLALAGHRLLQAFDQSLGVSWDPQQVRGFFESVVGRPEQ